MAPLCPGSMATTFPDNPAPEARLVLDALLLVVVGAVLVLVVGSGVGDADVGSLRLVVDGGGLLCDVLLCVVARVGGDTVVGVRADVVVLGCVIDCSGMSVRVVLGVGCSKPGTVTCTCLDAPPSAAVRVARVDVDVADCADCPPALPQAASNRTVMPCPAAINAARRLG